MGPLSIKADVQAKAGAAKNQMLVIKTLADEARKKKQAEMKDAHAQQLHQIKMAKEIAKAKAEGIPIDEQAIGAADGMLSIPKPGTSQPDTTLKSNNKSTNQPSHGLVVPPIGENGPSVTLKNPEAGPSDTIPAMLTPGEAVIPASIAQDSNFKPVIEALVNAGRQRNRQPGGVKGFADGTLSADDVIMAESGGNPIAKNPNSSATGLYQMVDAARKDVEQLRPDLKGKDFKDPVVQGQYRDTYKTVLANRLSASGIEPSEDNINKAWVVGAGGLKKIASNPDAPLAATLGDKAVGINPNLQGKTGAEFMADPNPYSRKGATPVAQGQEASSVPKPHRRGGTSGYMMDLARSQQNPAYDAELAKMAVEGTPEDQSIAKAEMARLQRARGIPPVQTPNAVPVPSPKAPDGFNGVVSEPKAAVGPDEDKQVLPRGTLVKQEAFDRSLEDPQLKTQLAQLQQTPPPKGVEPKSWLAEGLSKIFGPTGMFNGEDLIRFSLLAAGGMLTGGSTGGSLRFAGLATLRSSDERRAMQSAATAKQLENMQKSQAEAAKDVHKRNQSLENIFYTHMDKADPKAKEAAQKMFDEARSAPSPAMREAKMTQAVRLLASNQIPTDSGKNRAPTSGYDSKTGEQVNYMWSKDDRLMVEDPKTGNFVDARQAGRDPIPDSEFHKRANDQKESINKRLTARLVQMNQKPDGGGPIDKTYTESAIKDHAAGLTEEFMSLRRDMGFDMKPEDFSKIVDNTISNVSENYRGRKLTELTPEALRRTVYGSAVIAMRPTNKGMYEVDKGDGKTSVAGTEAIQNYGNAIQKALAEVKSAGVNMDTASVAEKLEKTFKGLPDKLQKDYTVKARANPGYSPYLLWVKDTYQSK